MPQELKTILVVGVPQLGASDVPTDALKMGLSLAKSADAFVTVQFLSPRPAWIPASPFSDFPAHAIAREALKLDEAAEKCSATASSAAEAAGVASSSRVLAHDFLAMMWMSARLAHLQDVVVMDAKSDALREYQEIIEGMLFQSDRPVILVPKDWAPAVPRKILIAWDGTIEATRAVRGALPILQSAEEVRLVVVKGEKDLADAQLGERLAFFLGRHDIEVVEETVTAHEGDVASALRAHAAKCGSDMIVMGAYAHSRFRQAVLGGVTRSLLADCSVPLFLRH